jgi:hypothetical protein
VWPHEIRNLVDMKRCDEEDSSVSAKHAVQLASTMSAFGAPHAFRLSGVSLSNATFLGEQSLEITMPTSAYQDPTREQLTDRHFMAWLPLDFHDGTIEVEVASQVAPNAPSYARGFVGVAFRVDAALRFESIYLRPTNAIADDQVRRNHTVQYFSHPDYPFARLRSESPEMYETYADIAPAQWIHMKITVFGNRAQLHLNRQPRPTIVINDMKLGHDQRGGVGLWIESGTIAYFRDLSVAPVAGDDD